MWSRDLDAAKAEAKSSHRDILIVFTGKGWCNACDLLEREVLTEQVFEKGVRGGFVLVELDFTFGDTKEEKAREVRLRSLGERYLVRGFPTVVLADADGVPYAIRTGYSHGIGVTPTLVMIRLAQQPGRCVTANSGWRQRRQAGSGPSVCTRVSRQSPAYLARSRIAAMIRF